MKEYKTTASPETDMDCQRNAVLCPRCAKRGTWVVFDGITYCKACRFWYAGCGPYKREFRRVSTLADVPARVLQLERRVSDLESRLPPAPPAPCPECGVIVERK